MLRYNVWARVEVFGDKQDEHFDINPEVCEYKVYESTDLEGVALFLTDQSQSAEEIEDELRAELQEMGLDPDEEDDDD